MNEKHISLINEEGEELLAEILFTHQYEGNNYIVFEFIETGDISAAIFVEDTETEGKLVDIETEEEWEMLNKLLDNYYDSLEDDEDYEEDEE